MLQVARLSSATSKQALLEALRFVWLNTRSSGKQQQWSGGTFTIR
jgi:hypothetical protein